MFDRGLPKSGSFWLPTGFRRIVAHSQPAFRSSKEATVQPEERKRAGTVWPGANGH